VTFSQRLPTRTVCALTHAAGRPGSPGQKTTATSRRRLTRSTGAAWPWASTKPPATAGPDRVSSTCRSIRPRWMAMDLEAGPRTQRRAPSLRRCLRVPRDRPADTPRVRLPRRARESARRGTRRLLCAARSMRRRRRTSMSSAVVEAARRAGLCRRAAPLVRAARSQGSLPAGADPSGLAQAFLDLLVGRLREVRVPGAVRAEVVARRVGRRRARTRRAWPWR
jgi:hypothetical protein